MDTTAIVAIITMFGVLPSVILRFVSKNLKHKRETEIEKLKYQKEILELEVQKQNNQMQLLAEEHKKLDALINGTGQEPS